KSFVALMGPSGCGKSTLMNALNGADPASRGTVMLYGLDLIRDYPILKRKIGYVPQQDIIHGELSVYDTLYYAAKLRMPDDTSDTEISRRIAEVLDIFKLNSDKIKKTKVKNLSGGERKRVSIAVELLNNPILLFLDEPTSPLDPETIHEFLTCIKNLCNKGTTVIMVTHKPEDLEYVDRVIFMAARGYPVFYDDRRKLLSYFNQNTILKVYSLLSIDKSSNEEMQEEHLKKYYNEWMSGKKLEQSAENSGIIKKDKKISLFRQFFWLTRRYSEIKISDKLNLGLLIAQPVIIATLLIFIFDQLQLGVIFMMAISAVWFGVSNASKEIVGELSVYKRERMYNLNIFTYLFSKISVLSLIALLQVIIFVLIVYARYYNNDTGIMLIHLHELIPFLFYIAFSATLFGLLLSAVFDNAEKVMSMVPIALMPQIILAGVIVKINNPVKEVLSYFTLGRWGTEGTARIQDSVCVLVPPPVQTTGTSGDILLHKHTLSQLSFYEDGYNLLKLFDGFNKNLLIITILNILVFIGIYMALKKKDSIKNI
ncbi:MAG: ATP-binding cassette domain-containing protein, partial [Bacteroidales bacterium]|nr:ATP-binding cassette domain-containing protein [Bacteroidales bacterium]